MVTDKHLTRIRNILYSHCGITLGNKKDFMIKNRLDKLRRDSGFGGTIDQMLDDVEKGHLLEDFTNAFTTNKTDFFREDFHFEDLKNRVLPELFKALAPVRIYCCASSTGEEPYSIAVTVQHTREYHHANYRDIQIIATDIDTRVLNTAKEGIYKFDPEDDPFPGWAPPQRFFKRRDFPSQDHLGKKSFLIKAKDELKQLITFKAHNLHSTRYPFQPHQFDVIFCRNVLIYFTQEDQNKILKRVFQHLKIGGTLYLGHSESPLDLAPYVRRQGQNIFVKEKDCFAAER